MNPNHERAARLARMIVVLALVLTAVAGSRAQPKWFTSPQASVLVCGGSMMNGDHFADSVLKVMRDHYTGCRTVALILHASHPDDRDRMEARLKTAFAHIGVPDARSIHRLSGDDALKALDTADGYFVGGGETFALLRDLGQTGQLERIRRRVLAGVPYGGASAGANVAGLIIGTTNDFPVADIRSREAFGLLPVSINPHHPTAEQNADYDARAGKIRTYLKFNPDETVLGLANASILRLHRGRAALVAGQGWLYHRSEGRALVLDQPVPELSADAATAK